MADEWESIKESEVDAEGYALHQKKMDKQSGMVVAATPGAYPHGAISKVGSLSAVETILPLLPSRISVQKLRSLGGGVAKEGWLWKEGHMVHNWKRRWFVLWPKEEDPTMGRILAYYKDPASEAARRWAPAKLLGPVSTGRTRRAPW